MRRILNISTGMETITTAMKMMRTKTKLKTKPGWPWLLGALVFVILSIGPYLYFNGELLRYDGRPLMAR